LDHYDRLVDALVARGIEPVVTLNHWDMPQDLMKDGGWITRPSVDAFAELARAVFDRIGDRVTYWITQNEPWIIALLGYHLGLHAPGIANLRESVQAAHHVLLGHGVAADILHESPRARVGAALSLYPCDPATDTEADHAAARGSDGYVNRWFLDPLLAGGYPADMREHYERAIGSLDFIHSNDEEAIGGRSDFLGVNYYTRRIMQAAPITDDQPFPWRVIQSSEDVPRTDLNWEITPDSLQKLLLRLSRDYPETPLVITENGAAFGDTPRHDGRIHDVRRQKFLVDHLRAIKNAITQGADVRGYLHWSLLDNFEWALGYRPRFGLVYVDYPTGQRTIKDSARLYSEIVRTQKLPTRNIEGELLS
ncbi:MAG TPA: family 1 glycosylhydrolase, partial [Actinomycetales bacterium]|nr:family 1 glycosylhydrolase [Actinomycetales bacterium]